MGKDYKNLQVGREFELIEVKRSYLQERTRTGLAVVIVFACLAALAIAAYFGIRSGDGTAVLKVWAVVAVPLSAITGYYFRGSKPGGENDNSGSI
ncbi:MAG: hypothetical protein QNJ16_11715 [Rhodobacter sp.]|nr:hypothetical protein [Rhodobacter sp.]